MLNYYVLYHEEEINFFFCVTLYFSLNITTVIKLQKSIYYIIAFGMLLNLVGQETE